MRWLIGVWLLGTCAARLLANGGIYLETLDTGVGVSADQQAIIVYDADRQQETLALTTQYRGNPLDFVWILPVPTLPARDDVATWPAGEQAFSDLRSLTDPKALLYNDGGMGCVCIPMGGDVAGELTGVTSPVQVTERLTIENLEIVLVSAAAGDDFIAWLQENGYRFPAAGRSAVDHYIDAGWKYIAVKVHVPSGADAGKSIAGFIPEQPLKIRFATGQPVFPMVISAASSAAAENEVLLYVFGQHRMTVTSYPTIDMRLDGVDTASAPAFRASYARQFASLLNRPTGHAFAAEYANRFARDAFTWGADILEPGRQYQLTRLRSILLPGQMQQDVILAAAESDTPLILVKDGIVPLAATRGLHLALALVLACVMSAIVLNGRPWRTRSFLPMVIFLALLFSMSLW